MTQQLHVAGLPRVTEDGYFDAANADKSWVRVHGGQSSEFPIYPTTLERTITLASSRIKILRTGALLYVIVIVMTPAPTGSRLVGNYTPLHCLP